MTAHKDSVPLSDIQVSRAMRNGHQTGQPILWRIKIEIGTTGPVVMAFEQSVITRFTCRGKIQRNESFASPVYGFAQSVHFGSVLRIPAANLLNRHVNVAREIDGVGHMETIETVFELVGIRYVAPLVCVRILSLSPTRADIVLCPGAV